MAVLDKYVSGESFAAELEETTDVAQFRLHPNIEPPTPRQLKEVIAEVSRKNLLKENPAVVKKHPGDDYYTVYLGWKWIQAACELNLPFYYIISSEIEIEDVAFLEQVNFKWSLKSYARFWANTGKPDYKTVQRFSNEYGLSIGLSIYLCTTEKECVKAFRNGTYKADIIDDATATATCLTAYRDLKFKQWQTLSFARAIQELIIEGKYDPKRALIHFRQHHENIREITVGNYKELIKKICGYPSTYK